MNLETMRPTPTWDPVAYEDTIDVLERHRDDLVFRVWGGDWCKDCRSQLPDFAAALDAAGIPEENVHDVEVNRDKVGPGTEEYGIEYIPTVVVEYDGEEIARFVEEEDVPASVYLAERIDDALSG